MGLDDAIWNASKAIVEGASGVDSWMRIHAPMERARLKFVNAARAQLAEDGRPLSRIIGLPEVPEPLPETHDRPSDGAA